MRFWVSYKSKGFVIEVEGETVTKAPYFARKFIGKSSKELFRRYTPDFVEILNMDLKEN